MGAEPLAAALEEVYISKVMLSLEALAVCGVNTPELVETSPGGPLLHVCAWESFQRLQEKALQQGFHLKIESGWRPFERQLSIWNRKARGELTLLDAHGKPINALALSPLERMWAILRWSALPGTSRHHWGTDLDISDSAAVPPDYEVQLTPAEVNAGGPFAPMHEWLDKMIASHSCEGFFRPFLPNHGCIQPERWHLSHAPSARQMQSRFREDTLKDLLIQNEVELLEPILGHLDHILSLSMRCYFLD